MIDGYKYPTSCPHTAKRDHFEALVLYHYSGFPVASVALLASFFTPVTSPSFYQFLCTRWTTCTGFLSSVLFLGEYQLRYELCELLTSRIGLLNLRPMCMSSKDPLVSIVPGRSNAALKAELGSWERQIRLECPGSCAQGRVGLAIS